MFAVENDHVSLIRVSNLSCTPVEHSCHFWACIPGCTVHSDLKQHKRCILPDTAHKSSSQSGRTPQDRLPDTDSETDTGVHPTCLSWDRGKKDIRALLMGRTGWCKIQEGSQTQTHRQRFKTNLDFKNDCLECEASFKYVQAHLPPKRFFYSCNILKMCYLTNTLTVFSKFYE